MTKPRDYFYSTIFDIQAAEFESVALEIFQFQYEKCQVYKTYVDFLKIDPNQIDHVCKIPFLPIGLFKSQKIIRNSGKESIIFESSGTTGMISSKHYVEDIKIYNKSALNYFQTIFNNIADYTILALLPNYLQKGNSSLVYMVNEFMKCSKQAKNGFYLDDWKSLQSQLEELEGKGQKVILFGVTYALIDFLTSIDTKLHNTTIIETGGMKGRKSEMTKKEVYEILNRFVPSDKIYSEYGMTELLSQSYAKMDGIYKPPPWMKILVRDIADPFQIKSTGTGLINIIDFANINSCSFIGTDDIAHLHEDGGFEILGRLDQSDLRGCSLLYN
ncbi:MAG: acyl transferase [Chitinophagales bacterium]|nr:acyl transferase [Chitinophagales bacterium]